MTISEIENLTYDEAKKIAIEEMEIKGHNCFFVDFNDGFGYSVLVYKNGKHIYYADDYELHHGYTVEKSGKEGLKQWYIEALNKKLYTDEELMEEVMTYDEYDKKCYFLRNYYIMRYDYISIWGIGEEDQKKFDNARKTLTVYNPISFCYVADEETVKTQMEIMEHLKKAFTKLKENNDEFRKMVAYELANHEACITGRYDDALDALGIAFESLSEEKQKIVLQELNKQTRR